MRTNHRTRNSRGNINKDKKKGRSLERNDAKLEVRLCVRLLEKSGLFKRQLLSCSFLSQAASTKCSLDCKTHKS